MPIFAGERQMTPEERASEAFNDNALAHFQAQTRLLPTLTSFSIVPTAVGHFFCARPIEPHLRRANPDVWWIFDEDIDETEGWIERGIFNNEGYIAYDNEGLEPRRAPLPEAVTPRTQPSVVRDSLRTRGASPTESPKKSVYAHLLEGLADARAAKAEVKPKKTNWERLREK